MATGAAVTDNLDGGGVIVAAGYVLAYVGQGMYWSVRWPAAADHDSLRARPTTIRASTTYVACGAAASAVIQAAILAGGDTAGLVAGAAWAAIWWAAAAKTLPRRAETLAVTVSR